MQNSHHIIVFINFIVHFPLKLKRKYWLYFALKNNRKVRFCENQITIICYIFMHRNKREKVVVGFKCEGPQQQREMEDSCSDSPPKNYSSITASDPLTRLLSLFSFRYSCYMFSELFYREDPSRTRRWQCFGRRWWSQLGRIPTKCRIRRPTSDWALIFRVENAFLLLPRQKSWSG